MTPSQPPANQKEPFFKRYSLRRFALFRRWPYLRWPADPNEQQIIKEDDRRAFPTFAEDFAFLNEKLMPAFLMLDKEAGHAQNQFHRQQVILVLGGALVTTLGAIQVTLAAMTHNSMWPGLAEAVLAAILAGVAQAAQASKAQQRYFSNRLKAETLRSEYFLFLGRLNPYDDQNPQQMLLDRIDDIAKDLTELQQIALLSRWKEVKREQSGGVISEHRPNFWELYYQRRYKDQVGFYESRKNEFQRAQSQATILTITLLTAASVVSLFGSADLLNFSTGWAVLAVFFPVLATALSTYQSVYAFDRQAKLYQDASAVLNTVKMPQTAEGSQGISLQDYVEQIEYIFKMEQGQWGQLVGQISGVGAPGNPGLGGD